MRDCEIVTVQFWNQDARLGAKAAGNSRQQHIMVGILLIEDIEGLLSCEVQALLPRVVAQIVNKTCGRQISDDFAILRIEHNQLSRLARDHEEAMIGFVQGHGYILRVARRQPPSSRQRRFVPIENANSVLTCNVTERPWARLFENARLDAIRVNFDIA